MGANGSRAAAPTLTDEKKRVEPTVKVVSAGENSAADGTRAAAPPAPRKNYGAYGCAISYAVQANAKQKQSRESRERTEAQGTAAKAS